MDQQQAIQEFEQAYSRGVRRRMVKRLLQQPTFLNNVCDALENTHLHQIVDRGLQTIPLEAITGSAAQNRNFDRDFLPIRKTARYRWNQVRLAFFEGRSLPPIDVIQIGNDYYIVDGHHRVSVARFMGQMFIDAHVIEHVVSQVLPSPGTVTHLNRRPACQPVCLPEQTG